MGVGGREGGVGASISFLRVPEGVNLGLQIIESIPEEIKRKNCSLISCVKH